LNFINKINR